MKPSSGSISNLKALEKAVSGKKTGAEKELENVTSKIVGDKVALGSLQVSKAAAIENTNNVKQLVRTIEVQNKEQQARNMVAKQEILEEAKAEARQVAKETATEVAKKTVSKELKANLTNQSKILEAASNNAARKAAEKVVDTANCSKREQEKAA